MSVLTGREEETRQRREEMKSDVPRERMTGLAEAVIDKWGEREPVQLGKDPFCLRLERQHLQARGLQRQCHREKGRPHRQGLHLAVCSSGSRSRSCSLQ